MGWRLERWRLAYLLLCFELWLESKQNFLLGRYSGTVNVRVEDGSVHKVQVISVLVEQWIFYHGVYQRRVQSSEPAFNFVLVSWQFILVRVKNLGIGTHSSDKLY